MMTQPKSPRAKEREAREALIAAIELYGGSCYSQPECPTRIERALRAYRKAVRQAVKP